MERDKAVCVGGGYVREQLEKGVLGRDGPRRILSREGTTQDLASFCGERTFDAAIE